jgi:hypothetical protein
MSSAGDKDFWIRELPRRTWRTVKPRKRGSSTNLNLGTGSAPVYSFLLTGEGRRNAGSEGVRERRPERAQSQAEVL